MVPLQTLPDYTLYGADISPFAGQLSTLSFTEPPPAVGTPSSLLLDDIVFSPQVIPEPTPGTLGLLCVVMLGLRRRDGGRLLRRADLNKDGRPDVIVGNKKGIFVHLSQPH